MSYCVTLHETISEMCLRVEIGLQRRIANEISRSMEVMGDGIVKKHYTVSKVPEVRRYQCSLISWYEVPLLKVRVIVCFSSPGFSKTLACSKIRL